MGFKAWCLYGSAYMHASKANASGRTEHLCECSRYTTTSQQLKPFPQTSGDRFLHNIATARHKDSLQDQWQSRTYLKQQLSKAVTCTDSGLSSRRKQAQGQRNRRDTSIGQESRGRSRRGQTDRFGTGCRGLKMAQDM